MLWNNFFFVLHVVICLQSYENDKDNNNKKLIIIENGTKNTVALSFHNICKISIEIYIIIL
jgi:hypothetical protein